MPKKKITKITPKGTLISRVVVVKGTPGKDGKSPIAGEDYKIPDRGIDGYTPIKGVDYFDGKDGHTPTKNELLALIIHQIPEPIPGKDGRDGIDAKDIPEEKIYKMVEEVVNTIEIPEIDMGEDNNGQWFAKDDKKMYIKRVTNIGAGMSTGVYNFVQLLDTPNTYVGQAGKVATVNAGETGLEFAAGGGGGAVDSVNGQIGVVVLDTGDIAEATDANYVSDSQLVVIGNTSGTNTGDQTTIVGITGTKAQFDTAVSDGNIIYTDAIGVSVQAYDADLTTWAGITPGSGVATFLATPSSANLAAAVTGETGSGALVFGTSPDFTTGATIGSVAIPTISSTNTLTNKRVQKRAVATTQSATPTINTDNGDIFEIVGLAQAITSMTTNLSGTPVEGEMIEIIFKDNGTARAITWGASFVSSTVTLPTTTVISTPLAVVLQYRTSAVWTATSAWYCVATA